MFLVFRHDEPGLVREIAFQKSRRGFLAQTLANAIDESLSVCRRVWNILFLAGDAGYLAEVELPSSLVGMATGMTLIWSVRLVGRFVLGREAMGFGDVTLMGMIGAFVGWQACILIFFLAPFAGLVLGIINFAAGRHRTMTLVFARERTPEAIREALDARRTVVLNLESTNKEVSRRLVDFLSGVAYANNGQIKRVANNTFIITPYNVDIVGDILDELESSGVFF